MNHPGVGVKLVEVDALLLRSRHLALLLRLEHGILRAVVWLVEPQDWRVQVSRAYYCLEEWSTLT